MSVTLLDRLLAECEHLGPASPDTDLEVLRRALVLEDVLGIILTDEQMSPDLLNPATVASLVPEPKSRL